MFPSSGLFSHFNCYLFEDALCERPHCVFKHAREKQEKAICDTSKKSTIDLAAAPEVATAELQWINQEIENVKHQVEEEQRRLSHYQINQASERTQSYPSKSKVIRKNVVKDSSHSASSAKCSKPKKYILDSSKPRTDLEYDPLSNFSSDLRSYCSSNGEFKTRNGHVLKKDSSPLNQNLTNVQIIPLQGPSPENSDSNEDDILVIDLPYTPPKSKDKTKIVTDSPSGNAVSQVSTANQRVNVQTVEQSQTPSNQIISKNVTSNTLMPTDENIFIKMTQRLSNYDIIPPQHSEQKRIVFNSSTAAHSLIKNLTNPPQKPQALGKNMSAADSSNVKTMQEQKRPVSENQPQTVFVGSLCEPQDILSAVQLTSHSKQQLSPKKYVISISSEDELNYSDMDVSESDPDEECYRIYMEANFDEKTPEPQHEIVRNAVAEKGGAGSQAVQGKRFAHEAKVTERPVAKLRPQPQVLVPLREPTPSVSAQALPMMRRVEQRASRLTASIKTGQALVPKGETAAERTQASPCSVPTKPDPCVELSETPLVEHGGTTRIWQESAPYVNYIPLGATVIDVGNNLHLVLPEGTFPVSDSSGQVTSVLTPITPVKTHHVSSVLTPVVPVKTLHITSKQAYYPSAQTQQRRNAQPVIIPPLARKPVMALTSSPSSASAVKPVATKRKLKLQCETVKVPHDIRQSYVNKFTEEFLKTTSNVNEAFEKALAEERTVYNRSINKLKYLSVAVNALKRLRNQSCEAVEDNDQSSQKVKGNIPLNHSLLNGKGVFMVYDCLKDYVLTEDRLIERNFPLQNPEKPGSAILFADNKKSILDPLRKICCRCGATYAVSRTGKHVRKEECTYHYGKGVENKVPGGVETRYSCCQGVMGSPGCQVFKLHVCNTLSMDGFVSTAPKETDKNCPGVFSLNCEMCYTIHGLELSRVTVVNSSLQIVYDTFVRPQNEVIDYNTRFSGISQEDIGLHCRSLKEVQDTLLSFISADTVLIGHSLETDLSVLKLLHGTVVDTSVVFPHRLGPPHKLSLQSLTAEYLRKIIQESVCGHDTAEDATACMELMIWKAKEDGKLKK